MRSRCNQVAVAALLLLGVVTSGWAAEAEELVAKLGSYKFGDSRENLSAVEALVLSAGQMSGGADRMAAMLHPLLATDVTQDCKQFVCRQLAVLGSKTSVAPLAPLLADEKLSDMARYALESIDDPSAGETLLTALARAPKKTAIGIINSLGNRQEAAAMEALIQRSQAGDSEIRAASMHALGQIGGERAGRTLLRLHEGATSELRSSVLQAILACADQFARHGQTAAAKALYESAFATSEPVMIRVAAFTGLVATDKAQALPLILKQLDDPELELQDAALRLVREFPGAAATQAFAQQLPKLSPPRQALLLRALADRRDRTVIPVVMSTLDSEDEAVRAAAWYALGQVGGAAAVERLARAASDSVGLEQQAARDALAALRGDDVDAAIMALLKTSTVKTRAPLAAALGARSSVAAIETLLQTAKDPDPAVRLASISALGSLASQREMPALVELLLQAPSGAEHEAAEKSIVATARRIAEPDQRLASVLRALSQSNEAARVRLLPVVAQIGSAQAISAVESALKDENAQVRESAVRSLAAWAQPEALPTLLAVVKSSAPPEQRLLALQGYIRLLAVPSANVPQETLAAYREAYGLATRQDEKRQIILNLPRVRIPETLTFILPLLTDPELGEDAARATVQLSTVGRRSTISRDEARAAMRQVLAVTKNPATREAATAILESGERR